MLAINSAVVRAFCHPGGYFTKALPSAPCQAGPAFVQLASFPKRFYFVAGAGLVILHIRLVKGVDFQNRAGYRCRIFPAVKFRAQVILPREIQLDHRLAGFSQATPPGFPDCRSGSGKRTGGRGCTGRASPAVPDQPARSLYHFFRCFLPPVVRPTNQSRPARDRPVRVSLSWPEQAASPMIAPSTKPGISRGGYVWQALIGHPLAAIQQHTGIQSDQRSRHHAKRGQS